MAVYDLTAGLPARIQAGDILNCPYSGGAIPLPLPPGVYTLECWGAQGGTYNSYSGGKGGYSVGTLTLVEADTLYLYTGGTTATVNGGFNGGGKGISNGKGGGGASDIRVGADSLLARVLVAGGGGGAGVAYGGGYGGGPTGGDGYTSLNRSGTGGTQTAGGTTYSSISAHYGGFGYGGNVSTGYPAGGGGSGWYGGGGAYDNDSDSDGRGGGGGSGFAWTGANAPAEYLLTAAHYLTDASTTAGNASFAAPAGGTETGHTGNGYIRVTVIEAKALTVYAKRSGAWNPAESVWAKRGGVWQLVETIARKEGGAWTS